MINLSVSSSSDSVVESLTPVSPDVMVTFNVNMSLEPTINDVSIAGILNNWTSEINYLTDIDNENIILTKLKLLTPYSLKIL